MSRAGRLSSSTCCASATTPDPGPAPVGMVRAWPGAGGGHRARQRRARPARPGAALADLCRRGRRQGARRGPARLPARRPRLPQPAAGRAAERRLRRHDGAPVPVSTPGTTCCCASCTGSTDARIAEIAAKAVKEVAYHLRAQPATGWSGSATAPRRAIAACRRRSTSSGCTPARCSSPTRSIEAMVARRHRRRSRGAARALARASSRAILGGGHADPAAARAGCSRAASAACTPSISATSWPRCSSCSAPIPTRRGREAEPMAAA